MTDFSSLINKGCTLLSPAKVRNALSLLTRQPRHYPAELTFWRFALGHLVRAMG